jgi:hypothetical protein
MRETDSAISIGIGVSSGIMPSVSGFELIPVAYAAIGSRLVAMKRRDERFSDDVGEGFTTLNASARRAWVFTSRWLKIITTAPISNFLAHALDELIAPSY